MVWVLFFIGLTGNQYHVQPMGIFPDMTTCFEAREVIMRSAPKPKVNYEAICIATKVGEDA